MNIIDIYQHISYHAESKKRNITYRNIPYHNISTMKTHQIPNKWHYVTCIKVPFSNQNLQNDMVTPRL